MFDRLIDLISNWLEKIVPFFIVMEYEEAVVLRFGKFHKVAKPRCSHYTQPSSTELVYKRQAEHCGEGGNHLQNC